MIFVNKHDVKENDFLILLEATKDQLLRFLRKNKKAISFTSFETHVYEFMTKTAEGTSFQGKIEQTGINAFPDIIANRFFGVEVKHTSKNHWTSTGNSVLETSRIEDVERIYMFFGKFGGAIDIKYRLYQECLHEVSVTHSPRYRINMDLGQGKSIFDKIGVDYDTLRKEKNPIQTIKNYYRSLLKAGEELWWIDQDSDDRSVSPIIKPFRNLEKVERENFIADCFILFPEMFGNSQTKFERAAAYLIAEYNAVSASLRDTFTAGGQVEVQVGKRKLKVPQIYFNLMLNTDSIKRRINELEKDTLAYYWRIDRVPTDRISAWKKMIDSITEPRSVKPSEVFDKGYHVKK